MSTVRAEQHEQDDEQEPGVILSPEQEAALVQRIATADESEKAGKLMKLRQEKISMGNTCHSSQMAQ